MEWLDKLFLDSSTTAEDIDRVNEALSSCGMRLCGGRKDKGGTP
jgi:hypothetical protein